MFRPVAWVACLAAALASPAAIAAPPAPRPVWIGGDGELDACGSFARPTGLKKGGDGFLSLRAGPGANFREVARLKPADRVYVCSDDGTWAAVVVAGAASRDCGVSTPVARRRVYGGPCPSGWVAMRYLEILAG